MSTERDRLKWAAFRLDHGDGIFSYVFYKPFVYLLLRMLRNRPVSPNKITALTMLTYIFSGALLVFTYGYPENLLWFIPKEFFISVREFLSRTVVGRITICLFAFIIVYNFALILDGLDGAVARYFNRTSDVGRLLDSFADSFGHLFVMIGLMLMFPSYAAFIAVFFFVYYSLCLTHLSYKYEKLKSKGNIEQDTRPIFRIGEYKILIAQLDHLAMSINGLILFSLFGMNIMVYLIIIDLLWIIMFVGYVILVGLVHVSPIM